MKTTWVALAWTNVGEYKVVEVGLPGEDREAVLARARFGGKVSSGRIASVWVTTKSECTRYYGRAWNEYHTNPWRYF